MIYLENYLPFTHIYISVFFNNTISICLLATSCKCIYTTICDHFAHRNRLYKTVLYFHFRGEIKIYHNCTWISIIWFDGIYVINTPLNSNLNWSSNILFFYMQSSFFTRYNDSILDIIINHDAQVVRIKSITKIVFICQ